MDSPSMTAAALPFFLPFLPFLTSCLSPSLPIAEASAEGCSSSISAAAQKRVAAIQHLLHLEGDRHQSDRLKCLAEKVQRHSLQIKEI